AGGRAGQGSVGLKKGKHRLLLVFAHRRGPPRLEVRYSGPDLPRQPIPPKRFFHNADSLSLVVEATKPTGAKMRPYGLPRRELATPLVVRRDRGALPPRLSHTGIFRSLADLMPNSGIVPYAVNAPLWSDGAAKRRWIVLPGDSRIDFAPTGEWKFPTGTVFV